MKSRRILICVGLVTSLAVVSGIAIHAAQDQNQYSLKVPNGLAVSEFKGYESWQLISISQRGDMIAGILGNPVIIAAYQSGIPGNGKPFPDGSKMAKIHWSARKADTEPGEPFVLGAQHDIDFMVKDTRGSRTDMDGATASSSWMPPPRPLGSAICRTIHRRGMMQSAALRATRTRRIGTTSSHNTRRGKRRGAIEPKEHPLAAIAGC
ncbi:cytochrome P460 family protein [Tunturibacter psychrotolerans]|uniref:Cytochrome P460 family protein n=1 Tax=Tunturiibacter psychrotolerans TaxID=3069686 RepID=A0AAU7ZWD5_9BACT